MSNTTEPLRGYGKKGRRIKRLKYRLLILADSHNSKLDIDTPKKKRQKGSTQKKFHKIGKENEWEKMGGA